MTTLGATLPLLTLAQPASPRTPAALLRQWSLGVTPLGVIAMTRQQTGAAAGEHHFNGGPAIECFARYTWPANGERWNAEMSAGLCLYAMVRYNASAETGSSGSTTLAGRRVAVRVARRVGGQPHSRWRLLPQVGVGLTSLFRSQGGYSGGPLVYTNPAAGQQLQEEKLARHPTRLGYEAGLTLARRLGPDRATELGLTVRYTNSFSARPVATVALTYDRYGVPQPVIHAVSRLEAVQIGVSLSYPVRARS